MTTQEEHDKGVQEIAAEYMRKGYRVRLPTTPDDMPEELRSIVPDIIAEREDEKVLVEFKLSRQPQKAPALEDRARKAQALGWRYELRYGRSELRPPFFADDPLTEEEIEQRIGEVEVLRANGHLHPALLMAWAAFEASLLLEATRLGGTLEMRSLRELVMFGLQAGLIDQRQQEELLQFQGVRNQVAHGRRVREEADLEVAIRAIADATRNVLALGGVE